MAAVTPNEAVIAANVARRRNPILTAAAAKSAKNTKSLTPIWAAPNVPSGWNASVNVSRTPVWCSTMTCVGPAATLSASTTATRMAIPASSSGVRRRTERAKPAHAAATSLATVAGVPGRPAAIMSPARAAAPAAATASAWAGGREWEERRDHEGGKRERDEGEARDLPPRPRLGQVRGQQVDGGEAGDRRRRRRRAPHPLSRRAASGVSPVASTR